MDQIVRSRAYLAYLLFLLSGLVLGTVGALVLDGNRPVTAIGLALACAGFVILGATLIRRRGEVFGGSAEEDEADAARYYAKHPPR